MWCSAWPPLAPDLSYHLTGHAHFPLPRHSHGAGPHPTPLTLLRSQDRLAASEGDHAMPPIRGYAAKSPTSKLEPFAFERREPGPRDVLIEILYCGICHSDIHQARDEWGGAIFPMVPRHEIVGRVTHVGSEVTRFTVGEPAGVGCFVDSCRVCGSCKECLEQYCEGPIVFTYNST